MRNTSCHTFLVLVIHFSTYGQQNPDSIPQKVEDFILKTRYSEALQLLDKVSRENPSIFLENKKAEVLIRAGRLNDASVLLQDVQRKISTERDDLLHGITAINTGYLQLSQGRSDLAEPSLQKALRLLEASGREHDSETAQALGYLGLVYMSQGKYTQAQEQLHQALSLREKIPDRHEGTMAATYNDLGLAYSQTDKDLALQYYKRALELYEKLYGTNDPRIAIATINTGIIYRELGLFDDAINNFERALTISNANYTEAHPAKAIALFNLGQTYVRLDDKQSARQYYRQALEMYGDCYGSKHPEIASVLNAIGNLQLAVDDFDGALQSYQSSLKANVQDFTDEDPSVNPKLRHYFNGTRLLHTLLFKAQAYEARYNRKSLKFSDLKRALSLLATCDSLIDQLRQHTTNESDKLLLGVIADEVYTDGVRISYLAGLNAVSQDKYFERALYFAEKSKGAVLLETISESNAKSFAGIPPVLLEEEKDLKSALALHARKLAEKPLPEEERELRESSFNLLRKYDAFVRKLEADYPEYFDLKFNTKPASLLQLQSTLADQTGLISYFIDEKNNKLYIFLIRKNHFRIWQRTLDEDFNKYITGLRNGIYFQEINTFKKAAHALGRTLLPPLPSSVTDLVILPVGRLSVIPFEALLTADAKKIIDYRDMPYVLNRYSIRYEFSAGLLLQKSRKQSTSAASSILLCAPVDFPDSRLLAELPGTEKEVQAISRLFSERNFSSATFTRLQADEQQIKSADLKKFSFLHFATHGVVDEATPELSRIFLRSGSQEDGALYAGEIYNLQLDAKLVTLSACQTGMGKIFKGEGVVGLSRALVYAGAANIIVSFWNVADESTVRLMTDFYSNLLQREGTYSESLRQSKLGIIRNTDFSAPFHWAPFVLIGY